MYGMRAKRGVCGDLAKPQPAVVRELVANTKKLTDGLLLERVIPLCDHQTSEPSEGKLFCSCV